jgi:oligopeptidase B
MTAQASFPPARRRAAPLQLRAPRRARRGPYHWLKDQSYPTVDDADVLAYLRAENAYFEAAMAPHRPLIDTCSQRCAAASRGRQLGPVRDGDWLYWWAFQPGAQYRTWYRRPVAGGDAQTIFDEPAEAAGKQYFRLGALEVSPDGRYAAIMVDDRRIGAVPAARSASSPPAATSRR